MESLTGYDWLGSTYRPDRLIPKSQGLPLYTCMYRKIIL